MGSKPTEHTHVEINQDGPDQPLSQLVDRVRALQPLTADGHHYIDRINDLIRDLTHERQHAADPSAARNLSLAITHLEDALLRVAPPVVYQPNPGARFVSVNRVLEALDA